MLTRLTPILIVDAIEPCLPFWTEYLGFQVDMQVPQGEALAFAAISRDGIEVMFQSLASVAAERPQIPFRSGGALYFEVDSLDSIVAAVPASAVLVPVQQTPYGSTEIWIREPGGHPVGFSVPAAV